MSTQFLAYRLQLFRPRSIDPTESSLLVPIGAFHSDNFDVATISGVAGAQPYLCLPQGNNGSLDPVNKNVTTGTRTVSVGDQPLTTAQPPTQVWVTAFLGDATGRNRLKGCKAVLYEQTTQGGSWNAIFTGRVGNVALDGKLKLSLELKSSVDDLNRKKVFLYDPHPNATYAFRSAIFPPRLVRSWASGMIPAGAWLSATISGKYTDANGLTRGFLDLVKTGEDLRTAALVTRQGAAFSAGLAPGAVFLKVTAGGATGLFRVPKHSKGYAATNNKKGTPRRYLQRQVGELVELPSTHPLHMALPANGTAVTFYIQGDDRTPVSEQSPLFIDDVHPLVIWRDILDGYFGIIDDATGTARPIAPRDASAAGPWDYTNAASPSFSMSDLPTQRWIITGAEKPNDWIIANICQPFNLSYRVDGQGRVIPLDLRPTSATAVTGAIVDADLTELPTDWTVDGSKALLGVNVSYYVDLPRPSTTADLFENSPDPFPDIAAAAQIDSTQEPWVVLNPLLDVTRDAGDAIATIDAKGMRLTESDFTGGAGALAQLDKLSKLTVAQQDTLAPYAGGAVTVPLSFTRDSAFAANGHEGQFWTITVSTLPDPATNQRGGSRIGLCLSKVEQGLKILATFLDVGSATPAAAPTIGTLAITNGGLDVPITLNAAGDPAQVEYIVTPAGTGSRPAATDPGWRLLGDEFKYLIHSVTGRQQTLPANTRLWVRARSRPMGNGLKLPSAYVFPAGGSPAGSIDVTAIAAPSAVGSSGLSGNRATVSWTNGDATKPVEIFLNAGGIPGGGWTDAMRVQPTLPAGSTTVQLRNLTISTTYGVAVRHRDEAGGTSAFATATFTTTGTPSSAPLTPPIGIGGGGGSTGTGVDVAPIAPGPRINIPVGVSLLLTPTDPAMPLEVQHAPDSAGAPNVGAATTIATNLLGTQRSYHDAQPLDGATHWYRHRHVGFGDTAGGWSDWVSAKAIVQRPEGPSDSLTTPLNTQSRFRCKVRKSATQTLTSGVLASITWDVEDFDVGSLHDNASNTNRITIPAGGDSGLWLLICNFEFLSNATAGLRQVQIRDNAGNILGAWQDPNNAGGTIQGQLFAVVDSPAVGAWFEVKAAQTSGVNQSFNGGGLVPNFQGLHDW